MTRTLACCLWLLLVPAAAASAQDDTHARVAEAGADLLRGLPDTWPTHVSTTLQARVNVELRNRSSARGSLREWHETLRKAVEQSGRLTAAPRSPDPLPLQLCLAGVLHGTSQPWVALRLYDAGTGTILAVGVSGGPPLPAGQVLLERLEALAAGGWPEGTLLGPKGIPVVRFGRWINRTRSRGDMSAIEAKMTALLVRSGRVEVACSEDDQSEFKSLTQAGGPNLAKRVGVVLTGVFEGEPGMLTLTAHGTDRRDPLFELTTPARLDGPPDPAPKACAICGEERGAVSPCPHCGMD